MDSSSNSPNIAEPKSIMERFYGSNSKDFRCQLDSLTLRQNRLVALPIHFKHLRKILSFINILNRRPWVDLGLLLNFLICLIDFSGFSGDRSNRRLTKNIYVINIFLKINGSRLVLDFARKPGDGVVQSYQLY